MRRGEVWVIRGLRATWLGVVVSSDEHNESASQISLARIDTDTDAPPPPSPFVVALTEEDVIPGFVMIYTVSAQPISKFTDRAGTLTAETMRKVDQALRRYFRV